MSVPSSAMMTWAPSMPMPVISSSRSMTDSTEGRRRTGVAAADLPAQGARPGDARDARQQRGDLLIELGDLAGQAIDEVQQQPSPGRGRRGTGRSAQPPARPRWPSAGGCPARPAWRWRARLAMSAARNRRPDCPIRSEITQEPSNSASSRTFSIRFWCRTWSAASLYRTRAQRPQVPDRLGRHETSGAACPARSACKATRSPACRLLRCPARCRRTRALTSHTCSPAASAR